jgi:hypothetical protein
MGDEIMYGRRPETTVPSALSLETVFETLSDQRKRYVLYALYRAEGNSLTIHRLARQVHGMEGEKQTTTGQGPEHVADDLRQRRLPELATTGAVEYDERSETVRYHRAPSLEEWLEHAEYKEGKRPGG